MRRNLAKRSFVHAVAIVTLVAVAGCSPLPKGLSQKNLMHDNLKRTYHLFVPSSYNPAKPVPLVLAMHGLSETGLIFARYRGLSEVAEREGFIVAYPQGIWRHWNSFGDAGGTDDVGFLLALIEQIEAGYAIDRDRVYATGDSNGGFMSFVLASKAPQTFAAIAPVMATMPGWIADKVDRSVPMPVLLMHGTDDPIVPWGSDNVDAEPIRSMNMRSIPKSVAFWVELNGCGTTPVREDLPDADPGDGTTAYCETYSGGRDGAEVVLYAITGGGHTWPGGREFAPRFVVGKRSKDFNASEAIWAFLSKHSRKH
jgi:polyhydroxybutyrate depolymerase